MTAAARVLPPGLEHIEDATLEEALRLSFAAFGDSLRVACSLSVEDMIILHEAVRVGKELGHSPSVFLIDTGRLHQESYDLVDRIRSRYALTVNIYFPEAKEVENLVRAKGPNSFLTSVDDRKECCRIRKVQPLMRALHGAEAWVTGLRREQSPTRKDLRVLDWDGENGGRWKLSPIAGWTEAAVWRFANEHSVPVHALHRAGYPSIGCAPCTRAISEGESVRAGRWWWEDPTTKECGLHARRRP